MNDADPQLGYHFRADWITGPWHIEYLYCRGPLTPTPALLTVTDVAYLAATLGGEPKSEVISNIVIPECTSRW